MKKYQLTPAENNMIQAYEYENRALKDIISFLNEECSDNVELIEKHTNRLMENLEESFVLKDEIISKYHSGSYSKYVINFKNGTLEIYE